MNAYDVEVRVAQGVDRMTHQHVLSICTGAGLLDKEFMRAGFCVTAGCEIDPRMRAMYTQYTGAYVSDVDLEALVGAVRAVPARTYDGIIGGPPCQQHTRMKTFRPPKFADLGPLVRQLVVWADPTWFLFENVVPIEIVGAKHVRLDAMHFGTPHQSRPRWFTYSANLTPPTPLYAGTVDDLMAYPVVMGRVYGPRRGAMLQGCPEFADLDAPCADKQLALANGVHAGLARAWAESIRDQMKEV